MDFGEEHRAEMFKGLDSEGSQNDNEFDIGNSISDRGRKVTLPGALKTKQEERADAGGLQHSITPIPGSFSLIQP